MSIQRYLEQLIEEIDEKMKIPAPAGVSLSDRDKCFFETDEIMENHSIPVTSFSKILKESLPPPEKLDERQSGRLVDTISVLLENWNFHLEYPERTPVKEKYRLIYDHWEEFEIPTSGWHFHQDFCTGNCGDCEVKDYCESNESSKDFDLSHESEKFQSGSVSDNVSARNTVKESTDKKEKIKRVLKSIQEKDIIPSMHNYCDRWCKMCSLRSRCSAFYLEKELYMLEASENPDKSTFEIISQVLSLTHDILEDALNENKVDFKMPVTTNDSFFPKLPAHEQKVLDFAKEYVFSTSEWLKTLSGERITVNHKLKEHVNVITYYHMFIPTKLARAFFGRVSYPEDEPIQNDSNGSAKVALLAIAKSLDSWTKLLSYNKDDEEVILQQCVKLKKLKQMVERSFPYAQKFVRPGFDSLAE